MTTECHNYRCTHSSLVRKWDQVKKGPIPKMKTTLDCCMSTDKSTLPQYQYQPLSVPRIIVLKIQKHWSIKTKGTTQKPLSRRIQTHHTIQLTRFLWSNKHYYVTITIFHIKRMNFKIFNPFQCDFLVNWSSLLIGN
jgi:hypothetical protein